MDQSALSSRAIMGEYFRRLEQSTGIAWVNAISNLFTSDQESEKYVFLGQSPVLREWVGGRQAKGFTSNEIEIKNKHYESTIEFRLRDLRRDKTPQIEARIADQVRRAEAHWASLLSTLILNGASTQCYDGQFFFDTDHSEGDSGTQSNDITVDISGVPAEVHGSTTQPSAGEMQWAIVEAIKQMTSFVDDRGEPMNEEAEGFLVMVPPSLKVPAVNALNMMTANAMVQNLNPNAVSGLSVSVVDNARLGSSWTDQFAVFRTDSAIKSLIRQQETEIDLKAKAEGSEFEFDNDAWQFGIDTWRNVAYGYWQHACLVTMV